MKELENKIELKGTSGIYIKFCIGLLILFLCILVGLGAWKFFELFVL